MMARAARFGLTIVNGARAGRICIGRAFPVVSPAMVRRTKPDRGDAPRRERGERARRRKPRLRRVVRRAAKLGAELRRERDFAATVLGVVQTLVAVLDRDGRIVRWNSACESTLGYTFEEVQARVWSAFLVPEEDIAAAQRNFDALCAGRYPMQYENQWRGRDGTLHQIEWRNTVLLDARGEVEFVVRAGTDVTEQRRLERELRQRLEDVAQMHRLHAVGEIAGTLAHQLNQPLAAIRSFGEAALARLRRNEVDPERLRRMLTDIVAQSERGAQAIRDLRGFLVRQPQELAECDFNAVVRAACALVEAIARDAKVRLEMDLGERLPPVRLRPAQIEQVIINLVDNAIDAILEASAPGGRITVSTSLEKSESAVTVTMRDSGPGLDAESARKVFEPLYTTKQHGIGLGLSIARSIIEDHGGRIWAQAGDGGFFAFTLPAAQ